jgi:hypothetical protein
LRFILRWVTNTLAFFFGLYLLDTLMAPHFFLSRLWIGTFLAVVMGAANSTNRPFRGFKNNRGRAFGFFGLTALANYLVMQIMALATSMSGNPIAIMFVAVCLTLLTALMNHLVGFKPVQQPNVMTREHGISDSTKERTLRTDETDRKRKSKERRKKAKSDRAAARRTRA